MQARKLIVICGNTDFFIQHAHAKIQQHFQTQPLKSLAIFPSSSSKNTIVTNLHFLDKSLQKTHFSSPTLECFDHKKPQACLGRNFDCILLQATNGFSLDAFLCSNPTLTDHGLYLIHLPNWRDFNRIQDEQAARFDIHCKQSPRFHAFLKQQLKKYAQEIVVQHSPNRLHYIKKEDPRTQPEKRVSTHTPFTLTEEQNRILKKLLNQPNFPCLVTGRRGTGKSTLLKHFLMHYPSHKHLLLCSAQKKNITLLNTKKDFPFYAPDALLLKLSENPNFLSNKLLIIEEAATIPLSIIKSLLQHSSQIIFISTLENYEGSGLGFNHKLIKEAALQSIFSLSTPLRFSKQDSLSVLDQTLSFLNEETLFLTQNQPISLLPKPHTFQKKVTSQLSIQHIQWFYQLLFKSHYRTHPLDLRRLFDATQQTFYLYLSKSHTKALQTPLFAAAWLIKEGQLDPALIHDIYLNKRRPKGNLSVQMLAAHNHAPKAASMKVLRISRICVEKVWQNQNLGSKLVASIVQDAEQKNYDYISVVFGFSHALLRFWQKNGFVWVHLGLHQDHITGEHSLLMMHPLSKKAKLLTETLNKSFLKDQKIWQQVNFIKDEVKKAFDQNQNTAPSRLTFTKKDHEHLQLLINSHRALLTDYPLLFRFATHCEKLMQDHPTSFASHRINQTVIKAFLTKHSIYLNASTSNQPLLHLSKKEESQMVKTSIAHMLKALKY